MNYLNALIENNAQIWYGQHRPDRINPSILNREFWKYHPYSLKADENDAIVMWTEGTIHASYDAGTHDGIRDGNFASVNTSKNMVIYTRLSDWNNANLPTLT